MPPVKANDGELYYQEAGTGHELSMTKTANPLWDRFQNILPNDSRVRVEHQVIIADRPGAKHILEILDKLGCDLIVMGTHGRSWLKHLLFGSVTEEVVRLASCPVMVVKTPAHKAAPPVVHASNSPGTTKAEGGHAG